MIRIEGLEQLLRLATDLGQLKPVKAAMRAAGHHMKGVIAVYPAARHEAQPFVSERQRRGFFARLRKGEIEVPYRRGLSPGSEGLGRRWTVRMENYGFTAIVGNNASYGRLVQDEERQTSYHRTTGWLTTQEAVESEGGRVAEMIGEVIERTIDELGK